MEQEIERERERERERESCTKRAMRAAKVRSFCLWAPAEEPLKLWPAHRPEVVLQNETRPKTTSDSLPFCLLFISSSNLPY